MPQSPTANHQSSVRSRCFGLRIESHLLQLAVATPLPNGKFQIAIDDIACPSGHGWLSAAGRPELLEALSALVDRHEMRRQPVAVSLDGDFCVTRVTMGTTEEVDIELSMQSDRVPRYLQLGPGEKVTGSARTKIAPTVDYAVTGVVNRSLIQLVYDALRDSDIDAIWVEPSLVSVARLVGEAKIGGDQPVMIADGTGNQWDVGIACSGRLLLDYRPASATTEEAFRNALDGHISRLKRFCHRHRGIVTGELSQLLICGFGDKPARAVSFLGDSLGVAPEVLNVPRLPELCDITEDDLQSRCVPAVATVLPLLTQVSPEEVPDLLEEVRRAPDSPLTTRLLATCWPIVAAVVILCVSYGLVSSERHHRDATIDGRAEIESRIDATAVKFEELGEKRELVSHLNLISRRTSEPDWNELLGRVTQTLPDTAKLNQFQVDGGGQVQLDGTVLDEPLVYELLQELRRLSNIGQVALKSTTPDESIQGTRFVIQLTPESTLPLTTRETGNE